MDEITLARDYLPVHPLPTRGLAIYVRREEMGGDPPEHVVVAGWCRSGGAFHIVDRVPLRALCDHFDRRVPIQDALPAPSAADREFIRSGISPGGYPGAG